MSEQRMVTVIAYNGIDGACAAAMALLKFPDAQVYITSAAGIGNTLSSLSDGRDGPVEAHVCGVGVSGDWMDVIRPAENILRSGGSITWYCGRGYLDEERSNFRTICEAIFHKVGSNTEVVCRHLELVENPRAKFLLNLARFDAGIGGAKLKPSTMEEFWLDFINASICQYFKYQDREAYARGIRKLARGEHTGQDDRAVKIFRRAGFKYALQGKSEGIRKLRETIAKCADADETVLITGETGTGKEHVAHLIHERSARGMEPFIPINCAVFAGNAGTANSMLFGHVRGAFTGAAGDRDGAFVSASGGILFLDEVGELPLEVQGKFLRVLEDGQVVPEGADGSAKKVDVRVISATNRDLLSMIKDGTFREDLYHRLSTLEISAPPLRERTQDIESLAKSILGSFGKKAKEHTLTGEDCKLLRAQQWPGNVRQLIKVLKRSTILGMPVAEVIREESIGRTDSREDGSGEAAGRLTPESAREILPMKEIKRLYAERALELCGGNYTAAAKVLGIAANTLRGFLAGR